MLRRARAAGYTGLVYSDYRLNLVEQPDPRFLRNVKAMRDEAARLGLDVYAVVFPVGYSGGLLARDPNLAEGLPVRNALFRVRGGEADLVPDPPVRLVNGGFEAAVGDRLLGWQAQDGLGSVSFVDRAVRRSGRSSLRLKDVGVRDPRLGRARVVQRVRVSPYRQYHFSVWVRTHGFEAPETLRLTVRGGGRSLSHVTWATRPTQDWRQEHAVFNSLEASEITLYLGVWSAKRGSVWLDDVRLEEVGLLNVLRRPGCPLGVLGEDGTVYREGRDFQPVRDEEMLAAAREGRPCVYHKPTTLRLTPGSRLREGQRLRVSFYHPVTIHEEQVVCCLSEPRVFELLKEQARWVRDTLRPRGFLMAHDEIRVANWCETCRRRRMTPGQLLADNARRCVEILREVSPRAPVYVWSDMFDPHHNARGGYYLANGSFEGSWEGLPRDVGLCNWNYARRRESLAWFAERGHPQVIAGYYDSTPGQIREWLSEAGYARGVIGAMYTTWLRRYDDLEAFAAAAWGDRAD